MKHYRVEMKMYSTVTFYVDAKSKADAIRQTEELPLEAGDEDMDGTSYRAFIDQEHAV